MKLFALGYPDEGNFGVLFYSTSWKKWEHFHSVYATLNCKHLFSILHLYTVNSHAGTDYVHLIKCSIFLGAGTTLGIK